MSRRPQKKKESPNLEDTQRYDRITKLETEIISRIQKLKVNNKNYICEHFNIDSPECESYD